MDALELRQAYDQQLRTEAETEGALAVAHLGSLLLATFAGGRGFVTYPHPDSGDAGEIPRVVSQVCEYFRQDRAVTEVEWKSRRHDEIPGLHEALRQSGFEPEEPESIMVGEARLLDLQLPLPEGVTLRRATEEADVRAMVAMQDLVFGRTVNHMAESLLERLARADEMQLWVAEVDGHIVSAGRVQPVKGTDFAGIWGGATLPGWRHRGIYRALTAARARAARAMGKTLIHSDSTEYSRPILERAGLQKISTTIPYRWRR